MATAASEEEEVQEKREVDTSVPAAPEQHQVAASNVDERKEKIEEALSSLGSCRARCSEKLEAAARGRHIMDYLALPCLEFLEKELSYIVAFLTALTPKHVDGPEMMEWLQQLIRTASYLLRRALYEADPQQRQTLLRITAQCFRRWCPDIYRLRSATEQLYRLAEDSCRYRDRSLTSSISQVTHFHDDVTLLTLYMTSMFPNGYKFDKDRLVMKWLCEGGNYSLLQRLYPWGWYYDEEKVEEKADAADRNFCHLVNLNVITRAAANSRRNNNPDEAEDWQLNVNHHHYQFIASKAAEVGFLFTSSDTLNLLAAASSTTDHGNETAGRIPRRLGLHHHDPNIPSQLEKIDLSQIRSLAVSVSGVPVDKFVNLVVLDVEGWENFGDEELLRVCRSKMFFLKYLGIRNTRVSKLPQINWLWSLQVLDASYTQVTEDLFGVFEVRKLNRLDLRGTAIRQLTVPKQTLDLEYRLKHLLLGGGEGMINSAETATRVPDDILRFRGLRTLATIDLSEQPASFINALGDLQDLRVIAITWSFHQSTDRDYCDALLSSIKKWEYLKSLTIHCGLGCSMEFLGYVPEQPSSLETFKVTMGRFAGVPQWFHELKLLSFVQITVCKLGAHDLEILRGLPELKCLILGLDFIPKEAIVIKNEWFPRLQRFTIDCPVPWLTFESGAMPELTYLQLDFCASPTSPTSVPLGISNLHSLTEVAMWYNVRYANSSNVKMTVEAVREEVAKLRNANQVPGLFINGIEQVDEEVENATGAPSGTNAGTEDAVQPADEITEAEN